MSEAHCFSPLNDGVGKERYGQLFHIKMVLLVMAEFDVVTLLGMLFSATLCAPIRFDINVNYNNMSIDTGQ